MISKLFARSKISKISKILGILSIVFLFQACLAGKPATPGLCSVSCSNAVFASPYAKIEPLDGTDDIEVMCTAEFGGELMRPMPQAVTIRFKIYEPAPQNNNPYDKEKAPRSQHQNFDEPRPGITFEPEILAGILDPGPSVDSGNVTVSESTDGSGSNGTEYFPSRWIGIATPSSQWCTDSCGTATIELWPMCVKGSENTVIFSAHSGSIGMEQPISYNFKNEEDTDTSTTTD